MVFENWCIDWGVPPEAVADLRKRIVDTVAQPKRKGDSEAAIANHARYDFCVSTGGVLYRNNRGAAKDEYGNFMRFGLANETKAMGEVLRSGDDIGIRPVRVTHEMVGHTIGQFVSREYKKAGWRYRGSKHERAQLAWANLVNSLGGDARFITGKVVGNGKD